MTPWPGHVLHVEAGRHLYGGALQVRLLIEGLHRAGVRNTLVCPRGSRIAAAAAPYAAVCPLPMRGDLDPRPATGLRRLIRRESPDLIHVHSRRGVDYWTPLAAAGMSIPLVLSRRVDHRDPGWLARWKYRPYARVIVISEQIRRVMMDMGVPAVKIERVYSAVASSEPPAARDRRWLARTFGIPLEAPLVGVVAQLIPRKGHHYLIDVLPDLRREIPNLHVLFCGQGPQEEGLRSACRRAGLAEAVVFAGFRRDMARIMPCLDVVAHPATMEGLGVALLEAAACARPVVAFRAGGVPEIVVDGENGLLAEAGDARQLGRLLLRLLAQPDLAARMGDRGRDMVRRRFAVEAMVTGNLAVYANVLRENQGAR